MRYMVIRNSCGRSLNCKTYATGLGVVTIHKSAIIQSILAIFTIFSERLISISHIPAANNHIKITAQSQFTFQDLVELWEYRQLVWVLATRNIKIRYEQTVLGIAWAIIQPLITMFVFAFIFGELAKLPTDGNLPHNLFIFSGLIPWQLFATGLTGATASLSSNVDLMTKVYFPRLVLPIISIASGAFDMLLSLGVLLLMMVAYGYYPSFNILFFPLFLMMSALMAFALGLWFSALNVRIRDIGLGIGFLLRIWLYLTPVGYSSDIVPPPYDRLLYIFNPMIAVVEGFRWSLFSIGDFPLYSVLSSLIITIIILISGLYYFKHIEAIFADVV
jgi:lipopolysaccharide transport system permease protein